MALEEEQDPDLQHDSISVLSNLEKKLPNMLWKKKSCSYMYHRYARIKDVNSILSLVSTNCFHSSQTSDCVDQIFSGESALSGQQVKRTRSNYS